MRHMLRTLVGHIKIRRGFWIERRFTGEYELLVLKQFVSHGKMAIDVGGNIGSYTYQLSKIASRVVTFEPNPVYVDRIKALKLKNVTVEQTALSDHSGAAQLHIPMAVGGYEDQGMASIGDSGLPVSKISRSLEVRINKLDDYRFEKVGFIKIDVEGHEESVLAGARQTIETSRPVILVEIEESRNPGAVDRINTMFASLGYSGYFYENGSRQTIDQFDPSKHQAADLVWDKQKHVRRTFPMVNNFLFLPEA